MVNYEIIVNFDKTYLLVISLLILLTIYIFCKLIIYLNENFIVNKFNKKIKNQKIKTFIITDLECNCEDNYLFKCKKCKLRNCFNLEDEEVIPQFFNEISKNKEINLILHLHGGNASVADIFCKLMYESKIIFNVFIPEFALSSGTLITLPADKIYVNKFSMFSPIDSQVEYRFEDGSTEIYSSNNISKLEVHEPQDIDCLQKLYSKNLYNDTENTLNEIFDKNKKIRNKVKSFLLNTKHSHEYYFTSNILKKCGIEVIQFIPDNIIEILNIYKKYIL